MARTSARDGQRGAALLLVLWTALLLSVVLAGALGSARIEAKIASARHLQFEADLALRAALDLAAWKIAAGEHEGDGPIVSDFMLYGFAVTVDYSIEGEKLDVNRSDELLIASFLRTVGIEAANADRLAAEIADWRDEDGLPRPNGAEAGDYASARGKTIGDRPFDGVGELNDVLHMTPGLYDCVAPALTLFGSGSPPSARVMALIGRPAMADAAGRGEARLGTSVRGATAGGVRVLEAVAAKAGAPLAPQKLTRVFRVSGRTDQPFEQVAEFGPQSVAVVQCALSPTSNRAPQMPITPNR